MVTTATALNYTLFKGGCPISSNPHSWQTCVHLLPRILTAAIFFQLRFLKALPRQVYKPSHFVLQPSLPQALPRLRLQRPEPQAIPTSRAGFRQLLLTILTFGTHAAILYYLSTPHQLVFNPRLSQAHPCRGYNQRQLVLPPCLPQAHPG